MRSRRVLWATLAALAFACGSGDGGDPDASAGDGDGDGDADGDGDTDADADGDGDGDADGDGDTDADGDGDADGDADADTDADGDGDAEVVIGGSMSPWGELEDGGELLVYEGHQGLSHFLSAIKERGLVIDPGVTAVYALTPAEGGPTIVQPGAETIQIAAFEFEPIDDVYMAAASGMHFIVLDQPQPELMEGESWVVSVEVTDAAGGVYTDTRPVIVHAVPL